MYRRSSFDRIAAAGAAAVAMVATVTACAPSSDGAGSDALTVFAGAQTPVVANFNPFSPNPLAGTLGLIYQPLFHFNRMVVGEPHPLLGTDYEFSEDGRELTVELREGVEWSDGEPFTAEDVVFSFSNDVSKPASFVEAVENSETSVTLKFSDPQFVNESTILGNAIMYPEHIWGDVEDPTSGTNEDPVGTGPYTVGDLSTGAYILDANENYWDEDKPALTQVRFLAIDGNQAAEDLLASGEIDYTSIFTPNYQNLVDAGLGYLAPPSDPTVLYTCANVELGCEGPQTDPAVREALYLAMDRDTITEKAFIGLTTAMSPTLVLLGRDDHWIAPGVPAEAPATADADAAGAVLEEAGYVKGSDGVYAKDGVPLELMLYSVDGWTDYNNAAKLIAEQATAAGIKVTAATFSWQEFSDSRQTGDFQLILGYMQTTSVSDPWRIYHDFLSTDTTGPVGELLDPAAFNFARYSNPIVDAAIAAAATTDDEATKAAEYAKVQTEIVRDLPYIPININAAQTFFNEKDFSGWPSESDPYAYPQVGSPLEMAYIIQQLTPSAP